MHHKVLDHLHKGLIYLSTVRIIWYVFNVNCYECESLIEYLAVFSHLIAYHEPELYTHLSDIGFAPEVASLPLPIYTNHVFTKIYAKVLEFLPLLYDQVPSIPCCLKQHLPLIKCPSTYQTYQTANMFSLLYFEI